MALSETQFSRRQWHPSLDREKAACGGPAGAVRGGGTHELDGTPVPSAADLRNRALWETVSDTLFVVRKDGVVESFQASADFDLMLSAEGLVGRRVMDLLPTALGQQAMHYVEKTLRLHTPQKFVAQIQLPGGQRTFQVRLAVCGANEVLAAVRDVTDRAHWEKELLEISHREQMRIGQDLHDGLGQHLTGITFLSRALEKKLTARELPEAAEASEISRLVMQVLSQTRSLARGLFPVELASDGLVPALRELASNVESILNIACVLACDESIIIPDGPTATHLFRLAQEAINNAARHGKARNIHVVLQRADDRVVLSISDDGGGFASGEAAPPGLGFKIMQYRALKVGGSLTIEPREGGGVVVTCTFPETVTD
jgi:signal transduction histidine kinase